MTSNFFFLCFFTISTCCISYLHILKPCWCVHQETSIKKTKEEEKKKELITAA